MLGGALKDVVKTALPAVGGALGTMVMPGIGSTIGSQLGSLASKQLGEYEVSGEAEFETARKVVELAHAAAEHAAAAPPTAPLAVVAHDAIVQAAHQVAPGISVDPPHDEYEDEVRHVARGHGSSHGYRGYGTSNSYGVADDGDNDGTDGQQGRWVRHGSRIILFGA